MSRTPEEKIADKENFLSSSNRESRQLGVAELATFASYYKKKYGIDILINHYSTATQEADKRITLLQDPNKRYNAFLVKWLISIVADKRMNHLEITPLQDSGRESNILYDELMNILPKSFFLDGDFRDDLTKSELNTLNELITTDISVNKKLLSRINLEIQILQLRKPSLTEAIKEIKERCTKLNPTESVGYIYTGQTYSDKDHYQSLILQKNSIICPTFMPLVDRINSTYFKDPLNFYAAPTFSLQEKNRSAQSDKVSCGTIGILYLKNLLKNTALDLTENSLKFLYYSGNTLRGLFIPSGHMLKYSQSTVFNRALYAMVNETTTTFTIDTEKGGVIRHTTIEALLRESIEIAIKKGDKKTEEENKALLNNLPEFRKKWASAAEKAMHENTTMHAPTGNAMLAYRNLRLFQKTGLDTMEKEKTLETGRADQNPNASNTSPKKTS